MPESPELNWTKSSFSEASGNACVEVAAYSVSAIALRESDSPAVILSTNRAALRALIVGIKAGQPDLS
ncbi:DUF397 domain-containing protein [Streptomyces sp. NBC_00654]|uniref:DUF397 domain-containing protein n=1 Tax=Streptomyces sp. NBC_00654 TaxID=2975799 RepID=UPI002255C69F|nr:DUF397 domain-containing protein [Streptomyces sp. NBC_00654]MCX4964963.1 DUF397 domain-containing protein [Streptomyces sp. NBC_00654]